jgi:hypothetical protein
LSNPYAKFWNQQLYTALDYLACFFLLQKRNTILAVITMKKQKSFTTKDEVVIWFSIDDVGEIVPDADMRYSLVILKDGTKYFVQGTKQQIRENLTS